METMSRGSGKTIRKILTALSLVSGGQNVAFVTPNIHLRDFIFEKTCRVCYELFSKDFYETKTSTRQITFGNRCWIMFITEKEANESEKLLGIQAQIVLDVL